MTFSMYEFFRSIFAPFVIHFRSPYCQKRNNSVNRYCIRRQFLPHHEKRRLMYCDLVNQHVKNEINDRNIESGTASSLSIADSESLIIQAMDEINKANDCVVLFQKEISPPNPIPSALSKMSILLAPTCLDQIVANSHIRHPFIRFHLIDRVTGLYLRKSDPNKISVYDVLGPPSGSPIGWPTPNYRHGRNLGTPFLDRLRCKTLSGRWNIRPHAHALCRASMNSPLHAALIPPFISRPVELRQTPMFVSMKGFFQDAFVIGDTTEVLCNPRAIMLIEILDRANYDESRKFNLRNNLPISQPVLHRVAWGSLDLTRTPANCSVSRLAHKDVSMKRRRASMIHIAQGGDLGLTSRSLAQANNVKMSQPQLQTILLPNARQILNMEKFPLPVNFPDDDLDDDTLGKNIQMQKQLINMVSDNPNLQNTNDVLGLSPPKSPRQNDEKNEINAVISSGQLCVQGSIAKAQDSRLEESTFGKSCDYSSSVRVQLYECRFRPSGKGVASSRLISPGVLSSDFSNPYTPPLVFQEFMHDRRILYGNKNDSYGSLTLEMRLLDLETDAIVHARHSGTRMLTQGREEVDDSGPDLLTDCIRYDGDDCRVPTRLLFSLKTGEQGCYRIALSPCQTLLAGVVGRGERKSEIRIYDLKTGHWISTLQGHSEHVHDLVWQACPGNPNYAIKLLPEEASQKLKKSLTSKIPAQFAGSVLTTASSDGSVNLFYFEGGSEQLRVIGRSKLHLNNNTKSKKSDDQDINNGTLPNTARDTGVSHYANGGVAYPPGHPLSDETYAPTAVLYHPSHVYSAHVYPHLPATKHVHATSHTYLSDDDDNDNLDVNFTIVASGLGFGIRLWRVSKLANDFMFSTSVLIENLHISDNILPESPPVSPRHKGAFSMHSDFTQTGNLSSNLTRNLMNSQKSSSSSPLDITPSFDNMPPKSACLVVRWAAIGGLTSSQYSSAEASLYGTLSTGAVLQWACSIDPLKNPTAALVRKCVPLGGMMSTSKNDFNHSKAIHVLQTVNRMSNITRPGSPLNRRLHGVSIDGSHLAADPALLIGGRDSTFRICKTVGSQLKVEKSFLGSSSRVTPIRPALSPDGRFLVAGSENGHLHVWETSNCKPLDTRRLSQVRTGGTISDVVWSYTHHLLAICASGRGAEGAPILVFVSPSTGVGGVNLLDDKDEEKNNETVTSSANLHELTTIQNHMMMVGSTTEDWTSDWLNRTTSGGVLDREKKLALKKEILASLKNDSSALMLGTKTGHLPPLDETSMTGLYHSGRRGASFKKTRDGNRLLERNGQNEWTQSHHMSEQLRRLQFN